MRNYILAADEDLVFDVIGRMWRHGAAMAIVTRATRNPQPQDVLGIISKEHIADSVAASIKPYAT